MCVLGPTVRYTVNLGHDQKKLNTVSDYPKAVFAYGGTDEDRGGEVSASEGYMSMR